MTDDPQIQHSVLGTLVLPVAQCLRLNGFDPLEVLDELDIDAAKLANPDWRISQSQYNSLMSHCVDITGDEAFGLVAAQQIQPQVLHGLGLAWLASDTVYDGLKRLVRFGKLMTTAFDLSLQEEGDMVHMDFGRIPHSQHFHPVNRDYGVGLVVRMSYLTLGDFLAPAKVELDRPIPEHAERWESILASKVDFAAGRTRVSWYLSDIVEPLITGDPQLARANDEQTQAYLDSFLANSTSREVVDKIVERLPDGPPNQQQIADALHVSNRTLQRKLKDEGTSFMDLLQNTRLQLAQKYLKHPNRSVVETAYLLGFSEPSTFSRAFKRWTGVAPADFRDQTR